MLARYGRFVFMAMTVIAIISASCSTTVAPPTARQTEPGEAKPYGSLVIAGQFSGALDPLLASDSAFRSLGGPIFDTLLYRDAKDELVGGIAERWEISPDGKTHSFSIRKGVKFHDGSDLTAADVKFSLQRMLRPESTAQAQAASWKAVVEAVEQQGEDVVLLRLKQPRWELLPDVDLGMTAVMPKKYIEEKGEEYFGKNPVGTGPWKFVKYEPGTRLELEAVDNHWRATPKFKNVTLLSVKEEATRAAMLKTGELDLSPVGPDAAANLEKAGVRIISAPEGRGTRYWQFLWYDLDHPETSPLGDVRVRKGLQLGINGKEIAEKIFRGYGGPFALHPVRPTEPYFDPNRVKADPFDPEGAKRLFAEAGYPGGFATKLWDTGGGSELSTMVQAIAGYWDRVGVKAEVAPIEYSAVRTKYSPKVLPEMWNTILTNSATGKPGFGSSFPLYYHSKLGTAGQIRNPKLDQLIDAGMSEKDPKERLRVQTEAVVLAKESYSVLSIVDVRGLLGVGSKIGEVGFIDVRVESPTALVHESITHPK